MKAGRTETFVPRGVMLMVTVIGLGIHPKTAQYYQMARSKKCSSLTPMSD